MSENDLKLDDLLEDFATSRVPEKHTVGGVRIGMINAGLAFAIPGLVTGLEIGGALGLEQSIWAFLLGGFLLALLGSITGVLGKRNRLTSCMTLKFVFGRYGANILSLAFALSLLGWYGVNMDLFSEVLQKLLIQAFDISPAIWQIEVGGGVLITLSVFLGFKVLEKISTIFVPVLFLIILYMFYSSFGYQDPAVTAQPIIIDLTFGEAVSAVVGSFIVSVALMPDFSRFAENDSDAIIGSIFPFLFICSFVYIASAYAGAAVAKSDILVVMLALGLGGFAFVILIMSSWVSNAVNLYSAALGVNATMPKARQWLIMVGVGVVGTIVASFNLLDNFTDFLFGLSLIFTPVAAVYATDFFLLRQGLVYEIDDIDDLPLFHWPAIAAWAIGVTASIATNNNWLTITTIEACDAILVTIPAYLLLMKFTDNILPRKGAEI